MTDAPEIFFNDAEGEGGTVGHIILNRPKALNALTFTMCRGILEHLNRWKGDKKIKAVTIKGSGDRAFCAGGDVRALYENRDKPIDALTPFFKQEYAMNAVLHHFPKPYVAFLHGVTMGGGVGVSLHGSHRIAAHNLVFAMPETGIGFFPDVGTAYFLSRCKDHLGFYLGLTGSAIDASDAYQLGIVQHIVKASDFDAIENALQTTAFDPDAHKAVTQLIQPFHTPLPESDLWRNRQDINHCFSNHTVEDIIQACEKSSNPFCNQASQVLKTRSPHSLRITLDYLTRARSMRFDQVIAHDYTLVQNFLSGNDFFEGVRAALVDRDQNPQWRD